MTDDLVKRVCVCGVDCHPGDSRCNGYCKGDAGHAAIYEVSSHQAPTGSNADEWALFLRDNTTEYCAVQIADRIEALQAEQCAEVKPLEWVDFPSDNVPALAKSVTQFGTYFIVDDTDDFTGVYLQFVSHDRAKWWQHVRSTCETIVEGHHDEDIAPLKAAAQADYERRILSAITTRPASKVRAEAHAAAIEAAASKADEMDCDLGPYSETTYASVVAEEIRALHTDASRASIERIKREAREEALREAIEAVSDHFPGDLYASNRTKCDAAITALIEKDKDDD